MTQKLGPVTATLLVMGSIIGVGIFITPAQVATHDATPLQVLSVWGLGALAAACGASTFAELGLNRPRAGGWFVYLLESFGPRVAFLFAWTILGVVATASIAVMADFTANSLYGTFGFEGRERSPAHLALSAAIPIGITALAAGGLKLGALVQNGCMVTKLLALVALAAAGFSVAGSDIAAPLVESAPAENSFHLATALLPVLFTFGGWQSICYVASEVRDPTRTLPRAILLGVLGVALVYLTLNGSMLAALGTEGLAGNRDFAGQVFGAQFGATGERLLAASMSISALGVCLVTILLTPWIAVAMSERRIFPAWVGARHPKTGAPVTALILQLGLCLTYLFISRGPVWAGRDFGMEPNDLVHSVSFAEWFFHGLVAVALMRFRRNADWRPLSFARLAPYVYVALSVWIVASNLFGPDSAQVRPGLYVVGAGLVSAVLFVRPKA